MTVLSAACGGGRWSRPGGTPQDLSKDEWECRAQVEAMLRGDPEIRARQTVWAQEHGIQSDKPDPIALYLKRRNLMNECLRGHGWDEE
jgi:hypothetical protein